MTRVRNSRRDPENFNHAKNVHLNVDGKKMGEKIIKNHFLDDFKRICELERNFELK